MHGNCQACAFSKKYADEKVSKKGQLVFCGYSKKATHYNATCDEFIRDNAKATEQALKQLGTTAVLCATCGYTWFAHQLRGMRGTTCEEFQLPALAQQEELFALDTVVKRRAASMEA